MAGARAAFLPLEGLSSRQEALAQVGQTRASIGLPLEQFEAMDIPLHRTGAVKQRQPGENSGLVLFNTARKRYEGGEAGEASSSKHALVSLVSFTYTSPEEHTECVWPRQPCRDRWMRRSIPDGN